MDLGDLLSQDEKLLEEKYERVLSYININDQHSNTA